MLQVDYYCMLSKFFMRPFIKTDFGSICLLSIAYHPIFAFVYYVSRGNDTLISSTKGFVICFNSFREFVLTRTSAVQSALDLKNRIWIKIRSYTG